MESGAIERAVHRAVIGHERTHPQELEAFQLLQAGQVIIHPASPIQLLNSSVTECPRAAALQLQSGALHAAQH